MAAEGIAASLIREFGAFPEVLAASNERLRSVSGSARTAALLVAVRAAAKRAAAARLEIRPLLTNSRGLRDYLHLHLAYERMETIRVLYLDAARRLVADEQVGRGDAGEAPFYVQAILCRALALEASFIVVAHNHPSGVARASEADRAATIRLRNAGKVVGINLLDHLIVTRGECVSVPVGYDENAIVADGEFGGGVLADHSRTASVVQRRVRSVVQSKPDLRHRCDDDARPADAVRRLMVQRRERDGLFPGGLFFDPCWNILLDLYACELEGIDVSVKSACLASNVPISTALRWVETLRRKGVISRRKDPADRRRSFLRLSGSGRVAMDRYMRLVRA